MKGLTLWQPWASLAASGVKWIETRGWYTSYRGPLLIHAAASASMPAALEISLGLADQLRRAALPEGGSGLPMGSVLAVAELANCCLSPGERHWPGDQCEMGDLRKGRYAWILKDPRPFDLPIPWKGAQGLWEAADFLAIRPELTGLPPVAPESPRPVQRSLFEREGSRR